MMADPVERPDRDPELIPLLELDETPLILLRLEPLSKRLYLTHSLRDHMPSISPLVQ